MVNIIKLILIVFIINNAIASINSTVNKTQITSLENIILTINIENEADTKLNINKLKQDFIINSKSQSNTFRSFNGKSSNLLQLAFILEPKRIGTLTIPAFNIGKHTSKAINIEVIEVDEKYFQNNVIYLGSKVNKTKAKIGEQIIYSIKLYSRIDTSNATLDFSPKINNALIKKLKTIKAARKITIDNEQLWLREFNFAIYPQRPGLLYIPAVKEKININNRGSIDELLLFTKAITLNIESITANYPDNYDWLVATHVKIDAKFIDKNQKFKVGEAITRELTIKVSSQIKEQIPKIKLNNNSNIEQYLDANTTQEQIMTDDIITTLKQTMLIIPNKAGKQTIPAISIKWFDANKKIIKITTLPAMNINVLPTPNTSIVTTQKPLINKNNQVVTNKNNNNNIVNKNSAIFWQIISFILSVLLIVTMLRCYLKNKKPTNKINKTINSDNYLHNIKKFAKNNNAKQTKLAIDKWLFATYKQQNINKFITELKNENLIHAMQELQLNLYSNKTNNWHGLKFWQIFSTAIQQKQVVKSNIVPDLYPDR